MLLKKRKEIGGERERERDTFEKQKVYYVIRQTTFCTANALSMERYRMREREKEDKIKKKKKKAFAAGEPSDD